MTDYKNELRSVLYDFLGDFKDKGYLSEGNTDEALAKLEALLSQHSKKRELEAQIKILAHILVYEATGQKRIGLNREGVVRELKRLQEQRDYRINKLGGQDE